MDIYWKCEEERCHQVFTAEVYGSSPLDRSDLFFAEKIPIHIDSLYSSPKAGADYCQPINLVIYKGELVKSIIQAVGRHNENKILI